MKDGKEQPGFETPFAHGDYIGFPDDERVKYRVGSSKPDTLYEAFIHRYVDVNNLGDTRIFDELKKMGLPEDATKEQITAVLEAQEAERKAAALAEATPAPTPEAAPTDEPEAYEASSVEEERAVMPEPAEVAPASPAETGPQTTEQ